MAYTLSWSNEVVTVKLTGVIDAATLMTMANEIASDYRFDELRKRIYDCTEVQAFELSLHDIKIFIHVDNATYMTNPNAHIAIVTTDKEVLESVEFYRHRFGHTDWQFLVCDTYQQALDWVTDAEMPGALDKVAESRPRPLN